MFSVYHTNVDYKRKPEISDIHSIISDSKQELVLITGIIIFLAISFIVAKINNVSETVFFVASAIFMCAIYTVLCVKAHKRISNESNEETKLNVASTITLMRGYLIIVSLSLVLITYPSYGKMGWLIFVIFGVSGLLDVVDGRVARMYSEETKLGERLDIETDGISILTGSIIVVSYGLAPILFILVGFAWYIYSGLSFLLENDGNPNDNDGKRWLNRLLFVLMYVSIWISLSPPMNPEVSEVFLSVITIPFLINFARGFLSSHKVI